MYELYLYLAIEQGLSRSVALLNMLWAWLSHSDSDPWNVALLIIKKRLTAMKIDSVSEPWPSEHPLLSFSLYTLLKRALFSDTNLSGGGVKYPQMFSEHAVYVISASDWRGQFAQVFFFSNKKTQQTEWNKRLSTRKLQNRLFSSSSDRQI